MIDLSAQTPRFAMTRLAHLLLLLGWFVGVLTGGCTIEHASVPSTHKIALVAPTNGAHLSLRADEIVVTMGVGSARWEIAAAAPPFVKDRLCNDASAPSNPPRAAPLESATFIPL